MSSEKRLLLAVGFSFLILILYQPYLRWISPKQPAAMDEELSQTRELGGVESDRQQAVQPAAEAAGQPPAEPEQLFQFSNKHFDAVFSSRGAQIIKLVLKNWAAHESKNIVLVDHEESGFGAFQAAMPNQGVDFRSAPFSLKSFKENLGTIEFSAEGGGWLLVKKFEFLEEHSLIRIWLRATNRSGEIKRGAMELDAALLADAGNRYDAYLTHSFTAVGEKLERVDLSKAKRQPRVSEGAVEWQALTRKYLTIIVKPDEPAALAKTEARGERLPALVGVLQFAPREVAPGETLEREFLVYAGPQYRKTLKAFGFGFDRILSEGFFGSFKLWLLAALEWTHKTVGNYGWAIILITIALKVLFSPLTHMSYESMKKMQALQPKIKTLQEQYKSDPTKLSQETMGLYKKHKVNPMGGCLPMVLQIPIFIAFYQVLVQTVELKGEPFIFWIKDLSEADRIWTLPFSLPFLGDGVNVLPILMIGSMVWQQKLTPHAGTPEQQKIMLIMPIVFGLIFYSLPSGLVLYWLVNNILTILHQLFIKGKALPHHEATA